MTVIDEKQRLARRESQLSRQPSQSQAAPQYSLRDSLSEALVTDGFQLPNIDTETDQPPPYGENHDHVAFSQPGFETSARVTGDGRINININTKNRRLAELLAPTLQSQIVPDRDVSSLPPAYIPASLGGQPGQTPPPRLNVVIQIVGSRGDVQPFVALGKVLRDTYGHRIRIATHPTFQAFVEENDLEFFNIGGDPAELMAFMVKHPGLMPGFDAITSGEVSKRRKGIQEILMGCWRSCIESGKGLGPPPKPHSAGDALDHTMQLGGDPDSVPFVADAIIANPPSFAHIHIAEKLGIPLHMMFTMPWSPTRAFPHPLANIQSSNADDVLTSYMSYTLVEMMTWQGLGDVINRFRDKVLDLPPLSMIWAPGLLSRLKIPWTYCWSPALIPKPNDWGQGIDVAGFYFLNLASSYTPDPELSAFLASGPPPVYIGFGSIVVDDPNALTRMIFDAVHLTGVRALVSKGWGGLGAEDVGIPEGVFMLGNCPHDWLFQHVSAVVHHGGAGTTAAGIKAGKPTIVVPFFGDQPFWGAMVSRAGAGPDPIPYKELSAEKLAEAIKFCLEPSALERATELGQKIREEQGTDVGGKSFHDHLDVDKLRCSVAPSRTAVWRVRRTQTRLSPLAAAILIDEGLLQYSDLKLYRPREYVTEDQPIDPISGCASSLVGDFSSIGMAIADVPREVFRGRARLKQQSISHGSQPGSSEKLPDDVISTAPSDDPGPVISPASNEATIGSMASALGSSNTINRSQRSLSDASLISAGPSASQRPISPLSPPPRGQTFADRDQSPVNGVGLNAALGTGRSVGRIVATGVKSPMNFCLGAAKGFRNIPRLYNDDTVRPIEKVTDLSTGIKVAGKEFGYGLFDGISGLVMQPYRGAEKEGVLGLIKGFGKGIGGFATKPAAGFWGIPAYTMQGVHAQVNKFFTKSVQNYIITSRALQGEHDMRKSNPEERQDILKRWSNKQNDLKSFYQLKRREKSMGKLPLMGDHQSASSTETGLERPRGWLASKKSSYDERRRLNAQKEQWKRGVVDNNITPPGTSGASSLQTNASEEAEFERAILASVQQTSRGNAEEDAAVEAAVRESVRVVRESAQLQRSNPELLEKNPALFREHPDIFDDEDYQITDEEYQALIEQAIKQSMGVGVGHFDTDPTTPHDSGFAELDATDTTVSRDPVQQDTPPPTDEDDELQRAIEESKKPPSLPPRDDAENDELERAIAASKEAAAAEASQRTEEEVVLEYIKKQSLAEEEYRKKMTKGKASGGDDDDEELRKAMEESLKMSRGDESGPSNVRGDSA